MNPLIRKGGSHHRMSQFSRPQPGSNPGCTSAALSPTIKFRGFTSVHPPPKIPAEFFSSLLKACTSSPKAEMSLSLLPAAGGAAPGPERRGARVDTHKGPPSPAGAANPSKQRGGNGAQTRGGGGGLGVPTSGPSAAPHHRQVSSAVPFPRPHSRRRGEPAALPPPADRAAAPPPRRAGGPWLPRGPSEALLHGELRAGPHPGWASGRRGYEPTPAEGCAPNRRSSRRCQAALAARPRSTSRARARGLRACKVCGARCGTR